jgi:RNA polymerase sigma factor (TIGR02999 family)
MPSKNVAKTRNAVDKELSLEQFAQLAYAELRGIAARYFMGERIDHTLQPTGLVHEVYIRLSRNGPDSYENRAHFFGTAARAMRQILVEYARAHNAGKRGAGVKVALHGAEGYAQEAPDYAAIDAALKRLAAAHPRLAEVAELRIFAGLSTREVADALGLTPSTVRAYWAEARHFLEKQL